jgi:AmmeMemoRadiSam system protein A
MLRMFRRSSDLSSGDGAALIQIARRAISTAVIENCILDLPIFPPSLRVERGAFVSLYHSAKLRGCVGQVENPGPLAEVVARTAVLAALHDSRFAPVRVEEVPTLGIELSVLSPPEPVEAEAVIVGQHGLMVVRGSSRGLLLPQVATERRWSSQRFLEETCAKAGLSRDAWRDAETQLFAFTAELFSDGAIRPVHDR